MSIKVKLYTKDKKFIKHYTASNLKQCSRECRAVEAEYKIPMYTVYFEVDAI